MGRIVEANCACGYTKYFAIACGMLESNTHRFPFWCEECDDIVEVNSKAAPPLSCEACKSLKIRPVSEPDLSEMPPNCRVVIGGNEGTPSFENYEDFVKNWELDDLTPEQRRDEFENERLRSLAVLSKPCWGLHNGAYKCPRCRNFSIHFETSMFYD